MIRRWLITLALLCLAVVLGYMWHRCARTVPLSECSDIYRRYADTPGVNAAYIKDYRVNDTMTVSATLLEAVDSTGWASLKKEFKIEALLDSIQGHNEINETSRSIRLAPKKDYNLPTDSTLTNNDLIITLFFNHIICIFHIENREQYNAVRNKQFNDMNPKF